MPWFLLLSFTIPQKAFVLTLLVIIVSTFITTIFASLFVLPLTDSKELNKYKKDILYEQLKKVCYLYKINEPKLYLTSKGRPNFYYFHFREKNKFVVLNQELVRNLDPQSIFTIYLILLNPKLKQKFAIASYFAALNVFALYPWYISLKVAKKILGKYHEKFLSGFYGFYKLLTFTLTELTHSIYYNPKKILDEDKIIKNFGLEMSFLEIVEKINTTQMPITIEEKILISNAFIQLQDDYFIYSIIADYLDPQFRLENIQAKV